MRKTYFICMCMFCTILNAQNNSTGIFALNDTPMTILEKPNTRSISGGTIINVDYDYTLISIANHATVRRGNLCKTKGSIDISDIPKGIYIFTVSINGKKCSSKFIK